VVGNTSVTLEAVDAAGNTATVVLTTRVQDTTTPVRIAASEAQLAPIPSPTHTL
jgi:hypothetical protein